jgi:hypothetical protein
MVILDNYIFITEVHMPISTSTVQIPPVFLLSYTVLVQ